MQAKSSATFFAVTAPGLEGCCAAELQRLGVDGAQLQPGGVEWCGRLADLYRANLWLRTASRVLVRVGEFRARDFPELHRKGLKLPWGAFIRPEAATTVRVTARRSRLLHTGRIAATLVEAIDRSLGRQESGDRSFSQTVIARLEDDRCLLSLDSSGELLHRRGYRQQGGAAPLRETLAAGILELLGWQGQEPLADPLCGSGTLVIEAGLVAGRRAPGRHRDFAFTRWPGFRPGLWQSLLAEADRQVRVPAVPLLGADRAAEALAWARANGDRAGLGACLGWHHQELSALQPPAGSGLLVCNPPYGRRLGEEAEVIRCYRQLGHLWRQRFPGWHLGFLAPSADLARVVDEGVEAVAQLVTGGAAVGLYRLGASPSP